MLLPSSSHLCRRQHIHPALRSQISCLSCPSCSQTFNTIARFILRIYLESNPSQQPQATLILTRMIAVYPDGPLAPCLCFLGQAGWLKNPEVYCVTVLEVRSLKCKRPGGRYSWKLQGKIWTLLPWLQVVAPVPRNPWHGAV